jgi:enamine deaminase RidA (YjgF/YER057c/UK114 family)
LVALLRGVAGWVDAVDRIIAAIGIQIHPTPKPNRILARPPADHRIVVARTKAHEPRVGVVQAACKSEGLKARRGVARDVAEVVVFESLGDDAGVGVYEETRSILANIDRLLAAAGTDKTHLLSATIWLTDMDSFADMNRAWDAWVAPGCGPARATVQSARLAAPQYKVEIGVIAAQP